MKINRTTLYAFLIAATSSSNKYCNSGIRSSLAFGVVAAINKKGNRCYYTSSSSSNSCSNRNSLSSSSSSSIDRNNQQCFANTNSDWNTCNSYHPRTAQSSSSRKVSTLFYHTSSTTSTHRMTSSTTIPATNTIRGGSSSTTTELHAMSTTATDNVDDTTTTTSTSATPMEIFRTDYQPLQITVKTIDLDFQLYDVTEQQPTIVTSTMTLQRNPIFTGKNDNDDEIYTDDVVFDGDESSVTLLSVHINHKDAIEGIDYELQPGKLILKNIQITNHNDCIVTIKCSIIPEQNTQLSGLYKSDNMFCTQCEAMGFRRITYYLDRPDNMSIFNQVRIEANQQLYPLLLSNGNLFEQGIVENRDETTNQQRHYAIWSDPYPKPSYLFALVAGKLGSIHDTFITKSGRKVQLNLYSEEHNVHKLSYAMDALKRSMEWDEQRYGLEYDLDLFNIVAVDNFNMGAMENKSLNIFNTAYVLASTQTATDTDYERIEAVIGHEYFHNWTGNRVTCRTLLNLIFLLGYPKVFHL
jgi:hypothetical protein